MSVVVFAYHDVGCMGLRTLVDQRFTVARVYTHDDEPSENHWFGSVRSTCAELGLVCTTADPHLAEELAAIRAIKPDAIFSLYYRDMLKDSVLSLAKHGGFNLHGSLLPRYRGRAPVNWQILHGETQGGVTLHHMVKRADAGDIIDQQAFEIGPDDTAQGVYAKMLPAAQRVLSRSAAAAARGVAPRVRQMESKATYFGRRRPADGLIDWCWGVEDVRNLVRAVTKPYPGAFTFAGSVKILVWEAWHQPDFIPVGLPTRNLPPGTVVHGHGITVACGDQRLLRLRLVEIDGRSGEGLDFSDVLRDGIVLGGA